MAMPNPEKISAETVIELFEILPPAEQAKLRQAFLEDEEDIRVSLDRLEHPTKSWSQEEMEQELDLAD
jgi:hypothetical protein